MKRVGIYLERKPESGGAYQYCLAVLNALAKFPSSEFEVTAFCTYEDWIKVTEPLNIRTNIVRKNILQKLFHYLAEKMLQVKTYRKYFSSLHPLSRQLKKADIDFCIYPCGDKISFMLTMPAIVSVFDLMHQYLKEFPEISDKAIYKSRERSYTNIAAYANTILVDSEVGKNQMIECYDKSGNLAYKIQVLPFIAPDYVYKGVQKKTENTVSSFQKYIFYPAQFWKHKNHKNLLLALAQLKKQGMIVNAVFCGSGKNAFSEVLDIITEQNLEDQIQVLGYVTNQEMVALYQNARALVMPTFGGPTNIPQLEAFALGCPVATSRIFGIPQQVGEAALLFDPDNIEEIAACIKTLWTDDDLCSRLKKKGYERSAMWGEKQFQECLLKIIEGCKVEPEHCEN